ncbi:D-amino acid aminotransferase [Chitinilyticum piscinae]|uniref:D-amino acid aminotransferase n=1 Tax=Chitinilyticum piscinae TaxID=2866724 RepID=A0A8J7FM53_9NEIS|nr:D-amino acid aminotransferase [Chitinilyticum piscinae]MBE9610467.1 D-amino acid aminotransferase [Chitinilyticum piscinae]
MPLPTFNAYLNGRFAPLDSLAISPMDRGFLFGDGVYEMIPVYGRHVFRLDQHLDRLDTNLAAIGLTNPHTRSEWHKLISRLVNEEIFEDQQIYLQVTRGVAWPRNHAFPAATTPTVFLFADELPAPAREQVETGVSAITIEDLRWQRCNIKAISLLANVLAKQAAVDAGVAEAILLRDGQLAEGAASNIFIVKEGILRAPPPSTQMLTGITYDVVIELAQAHGIPVELAAISEAALRNADEVLLTSSSKEVLAITTLDGLPVGTGSPGSLYRQLFLYYQDFKTGVMRAGKDFA